MKTTSLKKSVKRQEIITSPGVAENNSSCSSTKSIASPKVNVFQFMMDSRHKVIGSNSPGKEKKPEKAQSSEEIAVIKHKLNKRKEIFAEWSEKKGGLKRKETEETQEKHIKDTMLSRGKRLKQMLEIIDESLRNSSHDEGESDEDIKDAKNSSHFNENSDDNKSIDELKVDKKNSESKFGEKLSCRNGIKNTKRNNRTSADFDKFQKSKNKHDSNKSLILDDYDSSNESMDTNIKGSNKKASNSRTKKFKKLESKNSSTKSLIIKDNKNVNDFTDFKIIDIKGNEQLIQGNTNSKTAEENVAKCIKNNELDLKLEEKSANNNKVDTLTAQTNNNCLVETIKQYDEQVKLSIDSRPKKKGRKKSSLSLKKSNDLEVASEPEKEIKITADSDEEIFPTRSQALKTPLSSKNIHQLKLFSDTLEKNTPGKNEVFSPRTWRMKVRLLEKENVNNENEVSNTDEPVIIIDDKDTPEKVQGKISNFFTVQPSSSSSNSDPPKPVKLAPLFVRQPKKTKVEIESKRNFLHSGIPDHMKRNITTPKGFREIELNLFPKISHVQQKDLNETFWKLPDVSLNLIDHIVTDTVCEKNIKLGSFTTCETLNVSLKISSIHEPPNPLKNLKQIIKELKLQYPDYPVYKMFRLLYEKLPKMNENVSDIIGNKVDKTTEVDIPNVDTTKKRKRGRRKKSDIANQKQEIPLVKHLILSKIEINSEKQMWTEKYKPQSQDEIIGNFAEVKELKTWLESWVSYSEDEKSTKLQKCVNSNDSDDFCSIDQDSRGTDSLPQRMVILLGPFGCGKTCSVMALCSELNINVIEINASSKRPGKKILNDLQEATQSHQVKNTDNKSANSFFQKKIDNNCKTEDETNKKLSLLLMEDIDIVFDEQDDGFISSLTTLVSSTKRPIILTSSYPNCLQIQKLLSQHSVIEFRSLVTRVASPWLRILCLIEGVYTDNKIIDQLLAWNKGDLRKTILQLQYWVQSGGDSSKYQPNQTIKLTENISDDIVAVDRVAPDESSNLSWLGAEHFAKEGNVTDIFIHSSGVNCFIPFLETDSCKFKIPYPVNLGCMWWNLPSVLGFRQLTHIQFFTNEELPIDLESDTQCDNLNQNVEKLPTADTEFITENNLTETSSEKQDNLNSFEKLDLLVFADFLNCLSITDVMQTKLKFESDCEPINNFWSSEPVNSLLLTENYTCYNDNEKVSQDICHWLVEKSLQRCKKQEREFPVNVAFPEAEEIRWREKHHKSMSDLLPIIPIQCILDRRAISSDYFSTLRTIVRIENARLAAKSKRKNRFYHYLKNLNVRLTNQTCLLLCNTLATNNLHQLYKVNIYEFQI